MGERVVYLTKRDIEGRGKPVVEGTIIDVEGGVEWPLTSQEIERIIDVVAKIQRPLMRLGKRAEAIVNLQGIINEVAEEARHDTRGIRELKQAGVTFEPEKPSYGLKPKDRNLI